MTVTIALGSTKCNLSFIIMAKKKMQYMTKVFFNLQNRNKNHIQTSTVQDWQWGFKLNSYGIVENKNHVVNNTHLSSVE